MSVYKLGRVYWYRFMFRGLKVHKSSKSSSKEVAKRLEAEHRRKLELGQQGLADTAKPIAFSTAAKDYIKLKEAHWAPKTIVIHENSLAHLLPTFASKVVTTITPDDIGHYQRLRKKDGASGRSVNIEISLLRLVMRKHKAWANISDDVKMLKENRDIGRSLSKDEVDRLLAAARASASRSLYPAILISINTALRSEELRFLRWKQVDLKEGTITVGKSKTEGGSGRVVPLNQEAWDVLKDWQARFPKAIPTHYVFPSERYGLIGKKGTFGGHVAPYKADPTKPLGPWSTAWKQAKKTSGVQVRWHDLRHSAISRIAEGGHSDSTIQSIAGWMSPKMIERYSHTRAEAKRKAVESINVLSVQ